MNNTEKINVFIAHTPLQNFIAVKIVTQFFSSSDFRNILYSSVQIDDKYVFDEYKFIDKSNFIDKIINTYRVKKKIERMVKKQKTNLFISHTSALLDNYFFYSFPSSKYGMKINFFYEGILYFYEYHQKTKNRELFKRIIYGFLCSIKYRTNSLIFPSNHPKVNAIYSILPEFTLGPKNKINKISILKDSYIGNKNNILILGGKPSLLEDFEVIEIYKEMIKQIKSYENDVKVYFKGHHADTSNNFEKANNNLIVVEDITQNSPVEAVLEKYNPSLVLSYPSSGLINLKAMYAANIDMISYYKDKKRDQIQYLKPVFMSLGIQLKLI